MPIIVAVGLGIIAGGCALAVWAWGVVQVLDIMEALDLRRQAHAAELKRAKQYILDQAKNSGQDYGTNPSNPYTGYGTGTNITTTTSGTNV